jgi:hypothetical protein
MLGLLLQAFSVTALVWGFIAVMAVIIFGQNVGIALPPWITSAAKRLQRRGHTYIDRFQRWLKHPGQYVRVGLWIGALLIALVTWVSPEDSFFGQFRTEAVSIALVVIVIDELNRYRVRLEFKQSIKRQLASRSNDFALDAARIIVDNEWHRGDFLKGAHLEHANLEDADLSGANLESAKFGYARLKGADLQSTNLKGADLEQAILEGAILWNADFEDAKLGNANLEGAKLGNANLKDAKLRNAHLEDSILWGTNLDGVDLWGANFDGVVYTEGTVWPKSYTPPESAVNLDTASKEEKEHWNQNYANYFWLESES